MNILVCGGRCFSDWHLLYKTLTNFCKTQNVSTEDVCLIHGGAKGADSLADDWGTVNDTQIIVYPAKWDLYGKSAGMIRNRQMLVDGKPDIVIAFPGGKGTANMLYISRKAGIKVIEIDS